MFFVAVFLTFSAHFVSNLSAGEVLASVLVTLYFAWNI
jgi:hypothetical protein